MDVGCIAAPYVTGKVFPCWLPLTLTAPVRSTLVSHGKHWRYKSKVGVGLQPPS